MRKLVVVVALALAPLAPAACGGGDGGPVTARILEETTDDFPGDIGQGILEIEADPRGALAYTFDEAVAPPGNTNFVFENPQTVAHDVAIETTDGEQLGKTNVVSESSAWLRIPLRLGTEYIFYCTVPGHRKAGMEGIVNVQERS